MVASSTMDPESVGLVRDYVNELLVYVAVLCCSGKLIRRLILRWTRYMVKERERIFVRQYESASVAYQNISRS